MKNRTHIYLSIIAILMLLGCLGDWPYGYYTIMRIVVSFSAVCVAFGAFEFEQKWAVWMFGVIAVLFNPIFPIHLSRDLWLPVDLICAVLFGVGVFAVKEKKARADSAPENQGGFD